MEKRIVAVDDYGRGEIRSIGWDQGSDQRAKINSDNK